MSSRNDRKIWCDVCRMYIQLAQTTQREHENSSKHKANVTKSLQIATAKKYAQKKADAETERKIKEIELKAILGGSSDGADAAPRHPVAPNARVHSFQPTVASTSDYSYKAMQSYYNSPEYAEYYKTHILPSVLAEQEAAAAADAATAEIAARLIAKKKEEEEELKLEQAQSKVEIPTEGLFSSWQTVEKGEEVLVEDDPEEEARLEAEKEAKAKAKAEGTSQDDDSDENSEGEVTTEKRVMSRIEQEEEDEPVTFKRKGSSFGNKKNFRKKTS